jgi:hypothetical protein
MKIISSSFVFLSLMLGASYGRAAQLPTLVASHGQTLITDSAGKLAILVKIKTHEIAIGKPSDGRPVVIQSNCTYSRYPCSIVDGLNIDVNGESLFIPRSLFCDLADLNKASLNMDGKKLFLTLSGGDASESYVVKVEFDATGVKHRALYSATSLEQPLQETTYYTVAEGD